MRPHLFVKPVPGRRVLNPVDMQPIPEGGLLVERSMFWVRAVHKGDVQLATEPDSTESPAAPLTAQE